MRPVSDGPPQHADSEDDNAGDDGPNGQDECDEEAPGEAAGGHDAAEEPGSQRPSGGVRNRVVHQHREGGEPYRLAQVHQAGQQGNDDTDGEFSVMRHAVPGVNV
jgi:hypothetical protein